MQARKNFSEFVLSREKNAEKTAKYIFLGVPEENGSDGYSLYAGSSKGPKAVRAASHSFCSYAREEGGIFKKFIANSFSPVDENRFPLLDIGDKKTTDVATTVEKLITNNQFPIVVGGDHSITYEILKGINNKVKSFNVVYFDAHPDFLPSGTIRRKSYATVMYDASLLSHIDIKHSVQVGLRDYENEEFVSTEKSGINIFSTLDVERLGAVKIA